MLKGSLLDDWGWGALGVGFGLVSKLNPPSPELKISGCCWTITGCWGFVVSIGMSSSSSMRLFTFFGYTGG